jgi:hypothetical protein
MRPRQCIAILALARCSTFLGVSFPGGVAPPRHLEIGLVMDRHPSAQPSPSGPVPFLTRLNTVWHERSLQAFMVIVLAHWAEHLAQAWQIWELGWPVPDARGVLGLWFPWLVTSESLHYGYAVVMLICLWILRRGFVGKSHRWWMISFGIQFWHHIEHGMLQWQAVTGHYFLGSPVPISLVQLWIPRVELHLIYNTAVFIPMVVAMYYHMFPTPDEAGRMRCTCSLVPGPLPA